MGTLNRNLAKVRESIEAMPRSDTKAVLLEQLRDGTYQVELYTSVGNAARTAGRIDDVLVARLRQPVTRIVTFGRQ